MQVAAILLALTRLSGRESTAERKLGRKRCTCKCKGMVDVHTFMRSGHDEFVKVIKTAHGWSKDTRSNMRRRSEAPSAVVARLGAVRERCVKSLNTEIVPNSNPPGRGSTFAL